MAYRGQQQHRGSSRGGPPHHSQQRPGPPQLGPVDIVAITNCFNINRLPVKDFVQWDVFSPEVKIPSKREELIHKMQVDYPNNFSPRGLYDGDKIMLFWSEVRSVGGRFDVRLSGGPLPPAPPPGQPPAERRGVYTITLTRTSGAPIKLSNALSLVQQNPGGPDSLRAINALQLLIRQTTNQNYTRNKRAFFSPVGSQAVGGGFEFWRGFFQSVRPTMNGLVVNVDTVMGVMYKGGPAIDGAKSAINAREVRDLDIDQINPKFRALKSYMKNLKIHVKTMPNRVKVVRDLVPQAGLFEFVLDKTQSTTTVQAYYASINIRLQYPRIIGVNLAGKNSSPVIVPLELCTIIPGQLYRRKMPNELTSDAVRFSTMTPGDRKALINGTTGGPATNQIQSPILGYSQSEHMMSVQMQVSTTPLSVSGQILPAPEVKYKQGNASIQNGAWNLARVVLQEPQALSRWAVLSVARDINEGRAAELMAGLADTCRTMAVEAPGVILRGNPQNVERLLEDIRNRAGPAGAQLIVVLFPNKADDIRARVKHWGDVRNGVRTQCLREDKLQRPNVQYWANVAYKINARLGGLNSKVKSTALDKLLSKPTMVIGADVGHPGPQSMRPSVTSLVWSHDQHASQYIAYTSVQEPREEIIKDMKPMVKAALTAFIQKMNPKRDQINIVPAQILFYRDGVSEGEFEAVAQREVAEIHSAFDEVWMELGVQKAHPQLNFIVCGKRHHLLFFPSRQDQGDRNGNLIAGFVTDNRNGSVSTPQGNDFYLQSHAAIKGTSRSAHYTVLHQEFADTNALKDISYALCHVYAKATRSISIPAPIYYADMVCSRESFQYDAADRAELDASASDAGSGRAPFQLQPWKDKFKHVHGAVARGMYFL